MKKRSEKTNNKTIKKLKIACVASLTTIALSVGGFATFSYLQPSHYEGEVFNNESKQTTATTSSSTIPSSTDETGMVASDTSSNLPSEQYQGEQVTEGTNKPNYPTLTEDIVYSYAGCDYQEAVIKLKQQYGISDPVIEEVETSDYEDNIIIVAKYENNIVKFKVAKHVDTMPNLVGMSVKDAGITLMTLKTTKQYTLTYKDLQGNDIQHVSEQAIVRGQTPYYGEEINNVTLYVDNNQN